MKTELCYLAPLWQLYQKQLASVSPGYCNVPSVVRALTELFHMAETLAMVGIHTTANMLVLCTVLCTVYWVSVFTAFDTLVRFVFLCKSQRYAREYKAHRV